MDFWLKYSFPEWHSSNPAKLPQIQIISQQRYIEENKKAKIEDKGIATRAMEYSKPKDKQCNELHNKFRHTTNKWWIISTIKNQSRMD